MSCISVQLCLVYIFIIFQLVAAVVEDPLVQIPGGDCSNQNCTAEEQLWCAWPSPQRWPKMRAASAAPVADTVQELLCCHQTVRRLEIWCATAYYCSSSVL